MTERESLTRWRAAAGPWAHFLKPSLLVASVVDVAPVAPKSVTLNWIPTGSDTALVIDLPGIESLAIGTALGCKGWCIIPMFNTTRGAAEVLPTIELIRALRGAVPELPQTPSGPPAFLLDAYRQVLCKVRLEEGDFDNRWYVFKSDFPSEELLATKGIKRLIVVTRGNAPQNDLNDALAGHLTIERLLLNPDTGEQASFPKARPLPLRLAAGFGRGMARNFDGSFGHRYVISHG
ncbi:hypothetical protein [Pyxidicoccus caerfyrddinensis]|uniref:hypothetical protein n=1 Tax=Pyxidicoccus caerfyrddinensis TaxID=2709663 RepID=UPI0013DD2B05|nr:hypothetical protein [Pyxidicoccus caerfyrddinensis]